MRPRGRIYPNDYRCLESSAGGDGGIRTLDRALQPYNGLANRRLQPLGHVSRAKKRGATYARRLTPLQAPVVRALALIERGWRPSDDGYGPKKALRLRMSTRDRRQRSPRHSRASRQTSALRVAVETFIRGKSPTSPIPTVDASSPLAQMGDPPRASCGRLLAKKLALPARAERAFIFSDTRKG